MAEQSFDGEFRKAHVARDTAEGVTRRVGVTPLIPAMAHKARRVSGTPEYGRSTKSRREEQRKAALLWQVFKQPDRSLTDRPHLPIGLGVGEVDVSAVSVEPTPFHADDLGNAIAGQQQGSDCGEASRIFLVPLGDFYCFAKGANFSCAEPTRAGLAGDLANARCGIVLDDVIPKCMRQ